MTRGLAPSVMLLCFLPILILFSPLALAEETDCLYYFYGEGECQDCLPVNAFFTQLQSQYPSLKIEQFDVYYNKGNLDLLQKYYEAYDIRAEDQKIPVVFLPGSYFIGQDNIITFLEERVKDNEDTRCPFLGPVPSIGVVGEAEPKNVLETLTLGVITDSALKTIGSAAVAALLLLLILLLTTVKDKEQVLSRGIAYGAGAFLSYLLFGFGFFSSFILISASYSFLAFTGMVSVAAGAFWIASFLGLFKFFRSRERLREKEKQKQLQIPGWGMALLGFIVPLFTFALLEGKFLVLRNLFLGSISRGAVVPLLLYYLSIVFIPVAAVIIILSVLRQKLDVLGDKKGYQSAQDRERWKKHHWKLLNLVLGIILVLAGIIILS
ncbi:MAG: hypothetical protein AABX13_03100 [Nanoarchaeota archaeon]